MIRLVATDLDGTIVRDDGSVSPRTLSALEAAEQSGVRVVFVTGRPPRWMAEVADATSHRGLAVCANGAYVYDLKAESIVETHAMSVQTALEAAERISDELPGAVFAIETADGFGHEEAYKPRWAVEPLLAIGPIQRLVDRPIAKLLARDESLTGDEMLFRARPTLAGIAEVTHSNVNDCLLEVSALGVSKATTLATLAASWSIAASEVIAFGDMPNDVAMLQWAGRGYAMANSHPEVVAAVTNLAPSIHQDGVAQILESVLLSQRRLSSEP